ncbi:MAG: MraZ N-terminal domain containing protein [Candidatus Aenigmarchaeota archaeon]|nr:MraZ N-terminal domain containing protein [Candidatus Aenigmarchaeota archaeon]
MKFLVKLDDKGRISLPSDLRRSLGIDTGEL